MASLAGLVWGAGLLGGCAAPQQACGRQELAYVGTDGNQLRALRLDACSGQLVAIGTAVELAKPRWAVAAPSAAMLYVASDEGAKEGQVVAFAVDRATGALTRVNAVGAGGGGTTHLWLDAPSRTLLAANFGSGSASTIALEADGRLGGLVSTVKSTGAGPNRRQAGPHAHGVALDPSGRYALVADFGADRVFVDAFDRAARTLLPEAVADQRTFAAPAGSGPHHLVFGSDGRFVYLLDELSADILALRWDAATGRLAPVQTLPISSPGFQGAKSGSEIALSPDGRFIYAGNRGENTIVVYRVDAVSGMLSLVQRLPSGGEKPWTFAIHPSGQWMLVANQQSNKVSLLRIATASGELSDSGRSVDVPAPLSITFVP